LSFFENYNQFLKHFKDKDIENFNNLNKDMATPSSFFNQNDKNDERKIQPSKKVKSIRQLRNIEKEIVRLNYKEAILKGLGNNILNIQQYILSKTKILVEKSGIEYLKKSEELKNQNWFYNLKNRSLA